MAKPSGRGRLRCPCEHCQLESQGARAREHQLINQLVAILDERSRRLSVASLALQQGRGGLTQLARITGLSRNTIRRGIHELLHPPPDLSDRIRRNGGGRKLIVKIRSIHRGCSGRVDARRHGWRPDVEVEVDT
jgi:DNA-binding phage protein